ncbi:MAG TPA: YceI family protein [Actinomycetota bacterium]|nr:YceI family protein [Actinomycetota bacterium]
MTDLNQYSGTWTLDPAHTRIGFSARHAMVTKVRGSFTDFTGSLTLDAANPANSKATLTAQLASVDTGSPDRDAHLVSADFFDVANFPAMTFESTTVKQTDDDEFVLVGELTIKDVTRPVEIEVELDGVVTDPFGNIRAGFEGEAEISRKDFGLTWNVALDAGGVLVSDKIKIQLDVSATKVA